MSLLSVFKDSEINKIYKKIKKLNLEEPSKKRDLARIRSDIEEEYIKLSKILFKALNNEDYNTIKNILNLDKILLHKLVNEEGYNIILYSLYNSKNDAIIKFYTQYFDFVEYYFRDTPTLYSIILNRKNIDLMEFFIKTKSLRNSLSKQVIAPTMLLLFQHKKDELIQLLVNNFLDNFNNRDIKAYLIYFISYNNDDVLEYLINHHNLINKLTQKDSVELFALAFVNNNINAFEIMAHNDFLLKSLGEPYYTEIKLFLQNKGDKKKLFTLFLNR